MEIAVLLILPLVGGYVFARNCVFIRFKCSREDGHRLYFRAAFWGVVLFLASLLIHIWLNSRFGWYREFVLVSAMGLIGFFKEGVRGDPITLTFAGLYSMFLAFPTAKILNVVLWGFRTRFALAAIANDDFEVIFYSAVEQDMPVAMTMENKKVYVGFVSRTIDPAQARRFVTVLPLMSGYRKDADGEVVFTTTYAHIYGGVQPSGNAERKLPAPLDHLSMQDFQIAVPVDKIQSLNLFDVRAYAQFKIQRSKTRAARKVRSPGVTSG